MSHHVVIDYGVGNLNSLLSALDAIHFPVVLTADIEVIKAARSIILPGVGAFGAAMDKLKETGLVGVIKEKGAAGTPIFGICLGMQLLFESSDEYGDHEGLGLIPGTVTQIPDTGLKIPHMGWNQLNVKQSDDPLLAEIDVTSDAVNHVYYVHSYYVQTDEENIVATSDYGMEVPGIVRRSNVMGMQFHPEKSSDVGLGLLKGFKQLANGK